MSRQKSKQEQELARQVVVDASLAAMWVLPEPFSSAALALAGDWSRAGVQMVAPSFMIAEVTSALHKRVRRGELSLDQAQEALDVVVGFQVRFDDEVGLHQRALALAHELNRPTPYDSIYLALGELRGCEVWTGDERLCNSVHDQVPWIRWIGNYTH